MKIQHGRQYPKMKCFTNFMTSNKIYKNTSISVVELQWC